MTSPLVSVIVPVFNRASRIRDCVKTVEEQTYRPLELLVVDDGSTDETPVVLAELTERYRNKPDFRFVALRQENAGAPAARNRGIRECKGDWIQFLDSDDLLLPYKIERALTTAQANCAEILYSKAQYIDQTGTRLPRFWGKKLSGGSNDYFEFSWQTMCALYSRRALEKIGMWNENLAMSQDWEFCIRAVTCGLPIHFDDRVESLYLCEGDDRIGSGLTAKKHQGRENALWSVFDHLDAKGLLCSKLRKRFRSRMLHVYLSYRALNETVLALSLVDKMAEKGLLGKPVAGLLHILPNPWLASLILERFRKRSNAA